MSTCKLCTEYDMAADTNCVIARILKSELFLKRRMHTCVTGHKYSVPCNTIVKHLYNHMTLYMRKMHLIYNLHPTLSRDSTAEHKKSTIYNHYLVENLP